MPWGRARRPWAGCQRSLGLDIHPVANGGSIARVFTTGNPYITGHAEQEPGELPGLVHELGVRSHIAVRLVVDGERRGVVSAHSAAPDFFSDEDLRFLSAVAHWIGALTHRAELVEQVTSAALAQGRRQAAEELITVLAHDLRNYLTPLMGRLGLLHRRAELDGRVDDCATPTGRPSSVARLGQLISDLLDVGRIEQGLFEIAPTPMDLVSLARDIAVALGTPSVEIRVEGPPGARRRGGQGSPPPGPGEPRQQRDQALAPGKGGPHQAHQRADQGDGARPRQRRRPRDPACRRRSFPASSTASSRTAMRPGSASGCTWRAGSPPPTGPRWPSSSPPGSGATFRLSLPASGPPARGDEP